jgi:hypothetical protein
MFAAQVTFSLLLAIVYSYVYATATRIVALSGQWVRLARSQET